MCGIAGIVGLPENTSTVSGLVQHHRGPDYFGSYRSEEERVILAHNRLSIIDLTENGNQPITDNSGRFVIIFNGEVYNYPEIRKQIPAYAFKSKTDTEVVLAAFLKWGPDCLHRFIGMFAFAIWDKQEKKLFAARDRFGVKPFHYVIKRNNFFFASEIKTLFKLGIASNEDEFVWSTYLEYGMYDHGASTFWSGIKRLQPGSYLTFSEAEGLKISKWYKLNQIVSDLGIDLRDENEIQDELYDLLVNAVKLRFRSDVPVGVLLSGGLDSSLLLGVIKKVVSDYRAINTFTFYSALPDYDERPWVRELLGEEMASNFFCALTAAHIPQLAQKIFDKQDEPYGGFPTIAFSLLHQKAAEQGVKVLLDGNGIDEGWAGYNYYEKPQAVDLNKGPVQSAQSVFSLSDSLSKEFKNISSDFCLQNERRFDPLVNLQMRDIEYAKIPRAMRFADRVSMMYSRELREPFLDHRIIELGLRQPIENKIRNGIRKYLMREVGQRFINSKVSAAEKRPVQTPQREWLRGELHSWVNGQLGLILDSRVRSWFKPGHVEKIYNKYQSDSIDNSFPVWQLLSVAMMLQYKYTNVSVLK